MKKKTLRKKRKVSYTTSSTLLRNVQAGDETAWRIFFHRYVRMIRFVGKKRQLTPAECDDLMVDTMTVFWQKMNEFVYDRERGKFRSYLCRIANYCAIRIFSRRQKATVPVEEICPEYAEEIDVAMMDEWRNFLLSKAMEALKQSVDTEIYQCFYMYFVQHCSVEEISAVTRKTPNNIYVIRSRCLAKLTALIAEYRHLEEAMLADHSHKTSDPY